MKENEFLKANKELCEFLNKEIKNTEIAECIKLLKNGKSVSEDMTFNEPLTADSKILLIPLEKLFNLLFASHKYPYVWCRNILVSVLKGVTLITQITPDGLQ